MNELHGTQYSTEQLWQLYTACRPDETVRSNSLSTTYNNHDPSYLADQTMSFSSPTKEMAENSFDNIVRQDDEQLFRRQSFTGVFTNNGAEYGSSATDASIGSAGIDGYQFYTANEQMDLEFQRRSSEAYESGGFEEMKRNANMCIPQYEMSQNIPASNTLMNSNQIFQNMPENMFENIMSVSIGRDMVMEDESLGINLFSPQYSICSESIGLDQKKSESMITSPREEILTSHCEPLPNVDASKIVSPSATQNVTNDTTAFGSPMDSTMIQSLSNLSSSGSADLQNLFPHQDVSKPLSTISPTMGPNHTPVKQPIFSFDNVYSRSGFDLLSALLKVVSRKNPEIKIGKVDMSCAFTVCDILQYDCPIIYVSHVFEQMTGYTQEELKGQNCRFLQSPDGKVVAGSKRKFVDNDSVRFMKEKITEKKEVQRSVINYRKGGQPFMNMLTIIPITGEDDITIRYFVGFQIDLVETPASVEGKSASGTFNVNYCQSTIPRFIWQSSASTVRQALSFDQSISREDISTVLASIYAGTESELMKRVWDKILIENTDDVIHVISLKGLFLYLSPSSRRVLEYDASELVGTALSTVCHPSDIVSVTRELKDTSAGVPVSVVFRIRRKKSGYTWFESYGSLCIEQGKGRKCIILVGRVKAVYTLDRFDIESTGGIGECEMWNKISISGMFLFVSSSVRNLLDRSPSDLVGTSIQALMRTESKQEFRKFLDRARTGRIITHKHEILGKRGLMMQAQTTLFPGDASKGQKQTFFIAQTKLIKSALKSAANTISHTSKGLTVPNLETPQCVDSSYIESHSGSSELVMDSENAALASKSNIFDELKTTQCTSWQFELRQMEKSNRILAEELALLLSNKKKRKRRRVAGFLQRDCANCHTRVTPEWRRGPSGHRDLCNSCGLRYAKQNGRISARTSSRERFSMKSWTSLPSLSLQQNYSHSQVRLDAQNTPSNISLISSGSSEVSKKMDQPDSSSEATRNSDMTKLTGYTTCLAPVYECSLEDNTSVTDTSYGYGRVGE